VGWLFRGGLDPWDGVTVWVDDFSLADLFEEEVDEAFGLVFGCGDFGYWGEWAVVRVEFDFVEEGFFGFFGG
jgi:hypothetical protein